MILSLKASCLSQVKFSDDSFRAAPKTTLDNSEKAMKYLEKYGYFDIPDVQISVGGSNRNEIIKQFQEAAGLAETGELNQETLELMDAPRCGLGAAADPRRLQQTKWNKQELRYRVVEYSGKINNDAIDRLFRQAMDFWEQAANIKFTRSRTREVDIEIIFGSREHGDGLPFDGRNGVLAHAYFPGRSRISGDAHFDDDEDWSERVNVGKQLLQTMTHELGHSLGLGHSNVQGSVMYFSYPGWDANLRLHQDDISRIQALYGKSTNGNRPTTTTRPPSTGGRIGCTCDTFTRYDSYHRKHVGNCQSRYEGKTWCYIQPGAICSDSKRSKHVDKNWSSKACQQPTTSPTSSPRNRGKCECNGKSRFNERLQENVGLCQSQYRGQYWCYVSSNSACSDKADTKRNTNGLMNWSALACEDELPFQFEQVEHQEHEDNSSPFLEDDQVESQVVESSP